MTNNFNSQQKDIKKVKNIPQNCEMKDSTKSAIQGLLKKNTDQNNSLTSVLQKNITMKTTNNLFVDRNNKDHMTNISS